MKKMLLFLLGGCVSLTAKAQQTISVTDNLSWMNNTTAQTAQTSSNFEFCDGSTVNYTISGVSNNANFMRTANAAGSGMLMPAAPGGNASTSLTYRIQFNQPVKNLRILFVDLDQQNTTGITSSGETISNISPSFLSTSAATGSSTTFHPTPSGTGPYTGVDPDDLYSDDDNDNTSGWINWGDQSISTVNFTYNRVVSGYGLFIQEIQFECDECNCQADVAMNNIGRTEVTGLNNSSLSINSGGELIQSLSIDIPYYQSDVDDNCLSCDNPNVETFGTIVRSSTIAGVTGKFVDPFGTGKNFRKIQYNFNPAITINEAVNLTFQFPPVLELACCRNSVRFCLNVELRKADCSSCEYLICSADTKNNATESRLNKESDSKLELQNDSEVKNDRFSDDLKVSISPNPTDGKIQVVIDEDHFSGGTVTIHSQDGKLIDSFETMEKRFSFDIVSEHKGLFLFSIVTLDGKKTTKSIIKQ